MFSIYVTACQILRGPTAHTAGDAARQVIPVRTYMTTGAGS